MLLFTNHLACRQHGYHYYEKHSLTMAKILRNGWAFDGSLIGFALYADETLAFGKDIGDEETFFMEKRLVRDVNYGLSLASQQNVSFVKPAVAQRKQCYLRGTGGLVVEKQSKSTCSQINLSVFQHPTLTHSPSLKWQTFDGYYVYLEDGLVTLMDGQQFFIFNRGTSLYILLRKWFDASLDLATVVIRRSFTHSKRRSHSSRKPFSK